MKKTKLLIISILVIAFLSFIPSVNAEKEKWYVTASRVEAADSIDSWLRKVIWDDETNTELTLKAVDAWIRIQPLTTGYNSESTSKATTSNNVRQIPSPPIKGSGWTGMGGQSIQ